MRLLKQRSQQGDSCWFGAGLRYHLHLSPLGRDLEVEAPTAVGVGGTKVLGRASGWGQREKRAALPPSLVQRLSALGTNMRDVSSHRRRWAQGGRVRDPGDVTPRSSGPLHDWSVAQGLMGLVSRPTSGHPRGRWWVFQNK